MAHGGLYRAVILDREQQLAVKMARGAVPGHKAGLVLDV